jgi:hypothetical protein
VQPQQTAPPAQTAQPRPEPESEAIPESEGHWEDVPMEETAAPTAPMPEAQALPNKTKATSEIKLSGSSSGKLCFSLFCLCFFFVLLCFYWQFLHSFSFASSS